MTLSALDDWCDRLLLGSHKAGPLNVRPLTASFAGLIIAINSSMRTPVRYGVLLTRTVSAVRSNEP